MRLMTKTLSILVVLTMLLMTPALAATAKPVLVMTDYKVAPGSSVATTGPLMPGDTGTVVVTIANSLKSPGTGTSTTQSDTYNYWRRHFERNSRRQITRALRLPRAATLRRAASPSSSSACRTTAL